MLVYELSEKLDTVFSYLCLSCIGALVVSYFVANFKMTCIRISLVLLSHFDYVQYYYLHSARIALKFYNMINLGRRLIVHSMDLC
jgi:hypothetical protein